MRANSSKESYFFIETQFNNLGDAAINKEMIKLMASYSNVNLGVSKVPLSFISMIGKEFLESFTLDIKSNREIYLLKIILRKLLNKDCYLFLSPGGWIGELDGNLNLRSWLHAIIYFFMRAIGIKIIQLGVSYEDLGPKLLRLMKFRSKAYSFHYVRDKQSLTYLAKKNIVNDGICPDLAFNKFEESANTNLNKTISFSFRSDQYSNQLNDIKNLVQLFLNYFKDYQKVQFVVQVEKDIDTNRQLCNWTKTQFQIETSFIIATKSVDFVLETYRQSNVMVSNRLHALLLAGSVGNVMLAAPVNENNKKIKSLFQDVNLSDNIFLNDITPKEFQNKQLLNAMQPQVNIAQLKSTINDCFETIFIKD